MDIRKITDGYSVAPQLEARDMESVAAQGYSAVISNRPDGEVGPDLSTEEMRRAAEAAGLAFHANPIENGAMGPVQVDAQARILEDADGPVLAYCRSGTRSTYAWAFGAAGAMSADDIVAAAAAAGYDLGPARPQLAALAAQNAATRED